MGCRNRTSTLQQRDQRPKAFLYLLCFHQTVVIRRDQQCQMGSKYNMLGQLLDRRYQVVEVLGGGDSVKHTLPRYPGSPICVKHLKPASSDPRVLETARRLFKSEETLEQLGYHDQIPRLLAYFEENQEFCRCKSSLKGIPSAQN